jgi:hypothetical protein
MICDQLPATLLLPAPAGQPTKNERPHHVSRDAPNAILQPAPDDAERRDKQGRPHPSEETDSLPQLEEPPKEPRNQQALTGFSNHGARGN